MKLNTFFGIAASLLLVVMTGFAEAPEGFVSLFDGETFAGWQGATNNYEVVDGMIRCKAGKGGTLYTTKEYSDFVVQLEIRIPPAGNNGLALRYPGNGNPAYTGMCELQVLDNTAEKYKALDPRQYHGSVYGMIAAKRGHLLAPGEWNRQTVTVKGSTIKVELNGEIILDGDVSTVTEFMKKDKYVGRVRDRGFFGFAGHGSAVAFRNIYIKELNDE